jgi:hypothetical protein
VIIHSADKQGAASRLREAIAAEGYGARTVEVEGPDRLADALEGCSADARVLIWSRPLVSHSLHSGELPRIRQVPGLIEVSADGITPPSRGDDSRVVLISGWRGQPFHPGWQRIHLELKRLCGARRAVAEPPRPRSISPTTPPPPAASPRPDGPPVAKRLILGGAVAVLSVGAALGAASWIGGGSPDVRPRPETPPQNWQGPQPAPVAERPVPAPAAAPTAGQPVADAPAAAPASSSTPAPGVAPSEAGKERPQLRRAPRPDSAEPVERSRRRPAPPAQPAKKYSPKYSKVMRQFCERSGRSTPQCRTFLRSVRESR